MDVCAQRGCHALYEHRAVRLRLWRRVKVSECVERRDAGWRGCDVAWTVGALRVCLCKAWACVALINFLWRQYYVRVRLCVSI